MKHVQLGESFDYNLQREAWSVSRTCPIGFGSFSPRRNLLLDFEKIVPRKSAFLIGTFYFITKLFENLTDQFLNIK